MMIEKIEIAGLREPNRSFLKKLNELIDFVNLIGISPESNDSRIAQLLLSIDPLYNIGLSTRAYGVVRRLGIETIRAFMYQGEIDFLPRHTKCCGEMTYNEIICIRYKLFCDLGKPNHLEIHKPSNYESFMNNYILKNKKKKEDEFGGTIRRSLCV